MRRHLTACAAAALCFACLAAPLAPTVAWGQDAGLYDAPIPADAGFLRVIASDGRPNAALAVGDRTLTTGAEGASPYAIFKQGAYPVGASGRDVTVEPGSFTTLVLQPEGGFTVLSDAPLASPKASGIHVYNLSALPDVTLFAPEFQRAVVENVAAGTTQGRAFGEGALVLEVRAGDRSIATFPKHAIRRREAISVIVTGSAAAPHAALVENTVTR